MGGRPARLRGGTLVSRAGMEENNDHTGFVGDLFALVSRFWTARRGFQTQALPSVKMLLARAAARGAAEQRVVKGSAEWGLSPSSASEGTGEAVGVVGSGSIEEKKSLRYQEERGDGSRRSESHKPDIAVNFATRTKTALDSGSFRRVHGCMISSVFPKR